MISGVETPSSCETSFTVEPDGTLTMPCGTTGACCCSSRSWPRPRPRRRSRPPEGPPPRREAPASMITRRRLPPGPPARRRTPLPAGAAYAFSIASSSTLTSPSTTSMPAFLRWARTSSTLVPRWVAMSDTLRFFAIHLTAFRDSMICATACSASPCRAAAARNAREKARFFCAAARHSCRGTGTRRAPERPAPAGTTAPSRRTTRTSSAWGRLVRQPTHVRSGTATGCHSSPASGSSAASVAASAGSAAAGRSGST